jgi:hypothetical protein
MMSLVLIADAAGRPKDWVNFELAAAYYTRDKVIWETGEKLKKFTGGINAKTGERSFLEISSIIGVSGELLNDSFFTKESHYADRMIMYGRDRYMCAYCGDVHEPKSLTIDHVHPKSKGGKNTWVNCVTACKPCNLRKGNKTVEQAKMPLLYVPYAPNVFEKMILKNRKILADQMEFLLARVPKHSRILQ